MRRSQRASSPATAPTARDRTRMPLARCHCRGDCG
jgi:hypothetical protein